MIDAITQEIDSLDADIKEFGDDITGLPVEEEREWAKLQQNLRKAE